MRLKAGKPDSDPRNSQWGILISSETFPRPFLPSAEEHESTLTADQITARSNLLLIPAQILPTADPTAPSHRRSAAALPPLNVFSAHDRGATVFTSVWNIYWQEQGRRVISGGLQFVCSQNREKTNISCTGFIQHRKYFWNYCRLVICLNLNVQKSGKLKI